MACGWAWSWYNSVALSLLIVVSLRSHNQVKCEDLKTISTASRSRHLFSSGHRASERLKSDRHDDMLPSLESSRKHQRHGIALPVALSSRTTSSSAAAGIRRAGGRRRGLLADAAAAGDPSFTFSTAGGEVMITPITVHFIWLGPWAESRKDLIRTAFWSLSYGSSASSTPSDNPSFPTLERWWSVVREVRNASTGLPVTDTVAVGDECSYDPGANATVTDALVLESVLRAFNASNRSSNATSSAAAAVLNCSGGAPMVPQPKDAVYYLVISRDLAIDPAAMGGDLALGCSGTLDLPPVRDTAVKLVWSKQPAALDLCNLWRQRKQASFLGAPNGDSGLDTLVSTMLAQLAEAATAPFRQQDGLSISDVCPGPVGADEQRDSQPFVSDAGAGVSYNLMGLNGTRYMVQHLWSVDNGNCMLQPSDSCGAEAVESRAPQGRLQYGLIVGDTSGLQPVRPNLHCRWLVNVDGALFILIRIKYLATTNQEPLIVRSASCPGPAIKLDGDAWMRGSGSSGSQVFSQGKLLGAVDHGGGMLPRLSKWDHDIKDADDPLTKGCASSVAGMLYGRTQEAVDVVVQGSYMEIEYVTQAKVDPRSNGWVIEYDAGHCQGQETVKVGTGTISDGSPKGQVYAKGLNCSWVLLGKPNTPVALNFTRFDTVNGSDFVAIYKGAHISTDSAPIQTFSGNLTNQLPQIVSLGPVVLVFKTIAGGGTGWEATFRISDPDVGRGRRWTAGATGVVAAAVAVIFILALGVVLCWYRRKRLSNSSHTPHIQHLPLLKLNAARKCVFSSAQLFKATEGFSQRNLITRSARVGLYRGTLADGTVVTIQRPFSKENDSSNRELEILAGVANQNVVSLVGYSSNPVGRMLVLEHMENGSLRDALHAFSHDATSSTSPRRTAMLNWRLRLKIALQIARGLEYLHLYTDPCIIHRNVKSSNILLDSAWVPHITGFHRAVFCTAGDHVELIDDRLWPASTGPTDAPPSVHLSRSSTIQASKAGDIFGYGVLLLELLIGSQPRDTFGGDHTKSQLVARSVPLIESGQGLSILDPRLPVPSNSQALLKLADIAVWCLHPSTKQRPTILEVVKALEQVVELLHSRIRRNPVKFYHQR